jgi:hypothetical protein
MAGPLLLVHDDETTIAAIKRLLARDGYEIVVATSAADAVIAFGAHLPSLILIAPSVESDRGHVVLEELKAHPDGKLAKVLLLGESVPGFGFPVAPMPPDSDFPSLIEEILTAPGDSWEVREHERTVNPIEPIEPVADAPPPAEPTETAGWRAAPPPSVEPGELPTPDPTAPSPTPRDLEGALFGDLPSLEDQIHRQVEAEAMASVETTLQSMPVDPELEKLENEVRAEAARRRKQRELQAVAPPPAPPPVEPALPDDFAPDVTSPPPPPPRVASQVQSADLDALEKRRAEATQRAAELEEKVRVLNERAEALRAEWSAKEVAALVAIDAAERALEHSQKDAQAKEHSASKEAERLHREAESSDAAARQEREQRADLEQRLVAQAAESQAQVEQAGEALKQAEAHAEEAKGELALLSKEHEELIAEREALKADLAARSEAAAEAELKLASERDRLEADLKVRSTAAAELEMKLLEQHAAAEKTNRELEHERGSRATAEAHQAELMQDVAELEEQLKRLRAQLETEREAASVALAQRKAEVEAADAARAQEHSKVEALAVEADRAKARAKELEDRMVLPLAAPGRPPLGVPRNGNVSLGELGRLVAQLVLGQAEVRLELAVNGGTRNLWLRRGALVAAESTLPYETLSDRARRDGLIDARQEAELRGVRGASPTELLEVMRTRNLIREGEVVGLVQRYTEAVALDAFTEGQCTYRLHEEAVGAEVLAAAATRHVLPLVAEALRRALPPEGLTMLGGSDAVPLATETELDARALGFSERERRMLGFVDGEATVEDIVLAAGLKPDKAYKTLAVAKFLGLIEVRPPAERRPEASGEVDVQRLEAKYEQVQDADYFTILGLPRNAGTDEVQRAYERLSEEFDPIRFSGHPDPSLQQRAQVVHRLLEEAAKALEDDRRRAEYARHLLD